MPKLTHEEQKQDFLRLLISFMIASHQYVEHQLKLRRYKIQSVQTDQSMARMPPSVASMPIPMSRMHPQLNRMPPPMSRMSPSTKCAAMARNPPPMSKMPPPSTRDTSTMSATPPSMIKVPCQTIKNPLLVAKTPPSSAFTQCPASQQKGNAISQKQLIEKALKIKELLKKKIIAKQNEVVALNASLFNIENSVNPGEGPPGIQVQSSLVMPQQSKIMEDRVQQCPEKRPSPGLKKQVPTVPSAPCASRGISENIITQGVARDLPREGKSGTIPLSKKVPLYCKCDTNSSLSKLLQIKYQGMQHLDVPSEGKPMGKFSANIEMGEMPKVISQTSKLLCSTQMSGYEALRNRQQMPKIDVPISNPGVNFQTHKNIGTDSTTCRAMRSIQ